MAKMIFVAEDHNLNAVHNIADAVAPQDAVAFHQLEEVGFPLIEGKGIAITDAPDPLLGTFVATRVSPQGGVVNDAGANKVELAVKKVPTGGLRSDTNGLYILKKKDGHVETDVQGTFVDMVGLTRDPVFIDAVENLASAALEVTGVSPITATDTGTGSYTIGLEYDEGLEVAVDGKLIAFCDPAGGVMNNAGSSKRELAVKKLGSGGLRSDVNGMFILKKPYGHVGTDNQGAFVDMNGLTTDQIFIDAVENLTGNVTGIVPITAVSDGSGGSIVALSHGPGLGISGENLIAATDINGGLTNNSGVSKELGLLYKPDSGLRTDITGAFIHKKPAGHVGTDKQGTFVDMVGLTTDQIFIDAVEALASTTVTGVQPITVVDDGAGTSIIGLSTGPGTAVRQGSLIANTDPNGGLTNTSGVGKELALLYKPNSGLRTDTTGTFIHKKPAGGVATDNQGTYVDWTVVPPPTGPSDAANKEYVDMMAQGVQPLEAVRVATTGTPLDFIATLPPALDGIALADGDRILVKDQTNQVENGLYIYSSIGPWPRTDDTNEVGELRVGSQVFVSEGATLSNSSWAVSDIGNSADSLWTPGADIDVWVKAGQISGYIGGDGIDITGNIIAVNAGPGLSIVNDEVRVVTNDGSITVQENGIQAEVAPRGGLARTAQGPMVKLDDDSGLYVDQYGYLRTSEGIARIVVGTIRTGATALPAQTLTFTHNLGVAHSIVSVQDVNGCDVTVDVCRPNDNDVQIEFGNVPADTAFTVVVTG